MHFYRLRKSTERAELLTICTICTCICTNVHVLVIFFNTRHSLGPQDADSFNLEMRSFVSEIGCPHKALVQDLMALNEYHNRLLLLGNGSFTVITGTVE